MPRGRRPHADPTTPAATTLAPRGRGVTGEPPAKPSPADCTAYDRLVQETSQLQELTRCEGWSRFFGSLAREAEEARGGLEFAEKARDVVKLQATIALVKSQLKKLEQPVDDLNHLRERWPLFAHELPWRAGFDVATGRVTLTWVGEGEPPELESTQAFTPADQALATPVAGLAPPTDLGEEEDLDGEEADPDDPFGD